MRMLKYDFVLYAVRIHILNNIIFTYHTTLACIKRGLDRIEISKLYINNTVRKKFIHFLLQHNILLY